MSVLSLCALLAGGISAETIVARHGGESVSWGWVQRHAAALAARLRQARARRVGLWCDDGHHLLVGLVAAARAGCSVILPPADQGGLLAQLSPAWDVLVGDGPDMMPVLAEGGEDSSAPDRADMDVVFFTSGSTAQPKRVERRLAQLEAEVAALDALWPGVGWGVHHATVPHQHIYGLVFKLLWPLLCGRAFAARSHQIWESIQAEMEDGDVLVSSPAHLTRLGGLAAMPRPALLLSAGAALAPQAAAAAEHVFGLCPIEIFGSTETGAIASRLARPGTAWTPLPGNGIVADGDGLLSLRSPWVDGVHAGSDRVEILDDGRFHLCGRGDRVVKIEGKRVGLAAVEAALLALPQIADARVVALSAGRDQVAAAVVPSATGWAELESLGAFRFGRHLRAALAASLEPLARPRLWRFVAALPANSMGKRPDAAIAALFSPSTVTPP